MIQVFTTRPGLSGSGNPQYGNPFGNQRTVFPQFSDNLTRYTVEMPAAGTLRNLRVTIASAPGGAGTIVYVIQKNGSDTSLSVTLTDPNQTGDNTTDSVSVVAGDRITMRMEATGAGFSDMTFSFEFESANPRESIYCATPGPDGAATKYFGPFNGGNYLWDSTEGVNSGDLVAIDGVIIGHRARIANAPGLGNSIQLALVVDGVLQDGSGGTVDTRMSIDDTATSTSASFSLPVSAGQIVSVRQILDYSQGSDPTCYGLAFRANVDGWSNYCGRGINTNLSASEVRYSDPGTSDGTMRTWNATESAVEQLGAIRSFQLIGLIVKLTGAPSSGKSYTFDGRVNGAVPTGAPSATVADANTLGSGTGSMTVASGDTFAIRATPSGTPDVSQAIWTFGMFIPTNVGARVTQLVALMVQDRDPDPAVVTPPSGGGTVGAGTDPAAGISLCPVEVPIAFMDLTPPGGTTRRYSAVPINVTVADTPHVKSFGSVTRALVRGGEIRGSSASAVLIDTDRALRGLEATDSLPNAVIEYYLSSEAGIKAGATPRRVFSGLVTDSEPLQELEFRLQATDYLQALLDKVPLPTYPQRVFNVTDFPNLANDPKSTTSPGNPSLIGKPIPIGYGLLSDEHLGLNARGVVPAWFVGKRLVDGFDWDEYVVFGHAPSPGGVLGFFGDVFGGVSRDRFDPSFEGVDFLWPGHPGWTAAVGTPLYRDFNGNRYTVIYARGPRSDSAREGRIPFSINIGGVEDVGDGTGTLIDSLPLQILHLLVNFVLQDYTSGAWLAPPVVNGYSRVKTSSFTTVQDRSAARMGGSPSEGWLGAFLLGWNGGTVTLRDIARLAYEHGVQLGTNKDGQIIASTIDPYAAAVRTVTDITDTIEKSFNARRQRGDIRTHFWKKYARRYVPALPEPTPVTGNALPNALRESHVEWEHEDTAPLTDATGVSKYGARRMDLALELTRDTDTAEDLAEWHREMLAHGPVLVRYREGLCGTEIDLGDNHELTHFEGLTSSGWTDQLLRCEQHRLDLDRMEVEVGESRDLSGLAGSP